MPLTLPKTCSMGSSKTGLVGTIGVTLLNPDGTIHTARATADIFEIGGGCYGKNITFPDDWLGSVKWDTGGGTPVYATDDYSYYENNPIVDSIYNRIGVPDGLSIAADVATRAPASEYDTEMGYIPPNLDDVPTASELIAAHGSGEWTTADVSALASAAGLVIHDAKLDTAQADITGLVDEATGRWKIINNQMIFYKADNITETMRFNLFDEDGNPAEENVMERKRT